LGDAGAGEGVGGGGHAIGSAAGWSPGFLGEPVEFHWTEERLGREKWRRRRRREQPRG